MVYRFIIISDEVDNFVREIKIDSEATFYDLHKAILKSTGYKDDQMTSFFMCDDDWEKHQEITLEDMSSSSEEDSFVMSETKLSDFFEDEKQKMVYVFDPLSERVFFIELSEILIGKDLEKPVCSRKEGDAPKQTIDFDQQLNLGNSGEDLGENFYGDQDFDIDEFDPDGFEVGDGSSSDSFQE